MTKTWLDKLCEPLEHPKYPQIYGKLIRINRNGEIIGKCAEGEILCQNNIMFNQDAYFMSDCHFSELGVPSDLSSRLLPQLFGSKYDDYRIGDYIVGLNDAEFTYDEIAEFLRTTFEDAV